MNEQVAYKRRWWALAAFSLSVVLVTVDNTILAVAVPSLAEDLNPSPAELLWIGDIYGFVLAGLLITMGATGDRFGRKRMLFIGLIGFAIVSVAAAFSPNSMTLIFWRAVLGVFGAMLMPSTMSLIRSTFPDRNERTFAISVWAAVAAAGGGLGPVLGGALLEHFWWGSVFLVNVPIVIVILLIGWFAIAESKDPNPGRIDLISAGLLLVGMVAFIFAVKEIALEGFSHPLPVAAAVVGPLALFIFVRRQLQLETPMLDVRLFRVPAFSGAVLADLISVFGLMGVYFFLAQQFQFAEHETPFQAGLRLVPAEIAALLGALIAARIIIRSGRRIAIGGGITLGAFGMLFLGLIHVSGIALVTLSMVMIGLGFGISLTGTSDAILAAAPPDRAGSAAAVSETAYELGAALGIAVLGTVLTVVYQAKVVIPSGLPENVSHAMGASLSEAFEAAKELPAATAAAVEQAAATAFTDAFAVTCIAAAIVAFAGAFTAFKVLPNKANEPEAVEH